MGKTAAGKKGKDKYIQLLVISGPNSGIVFAILLLCKLIAG